MVREFLRKAPVLLSNVLITGRLASAEERATSRNAAAHVGDVARVTRYEG
jgi:hypothetical protein